jgi:hypothetical protein
MNHGMHHGFLLIIIILLLWRGHRRRATVASPSNSDTAGAAGCGARVALAILVAWLTILAIVTIMGMIMGLISHWPVKQRAPVSAVSAASDSARSAASSRKMWAMKQRASHATRSGKEKRSPVLVAKTETPPAAIPKLRAEAENSSVVKSDAAKPPAAAAKTRPTWVDASPQVIDGVYQTNITVGPYTTRGECDAKLPEALQDAITHYVDVYLDEDIPGRIPLPDDNFCRQLVKDRWEETRQSSVGPMIQLHVLLGFDRQVKERVLEAYRQTLVAERLWWTGGALAAVLTLLAALYSYLKWSSGSPESSPCLPPKSMPC